MKNIVVSQPMYFPWVGLFEQVRLADVYVHYDDVQLPQGRSFTNRVQIKGTNGVHWLTVPLRHQGKQLIKDVLVDDTQPWREEHLKTLRHSYGKCPYGEEMLAIAEAIMGLETSFLSEINRVGMEKIAAYFGLSPCFLRSSDLMVSAASTERLLGIVQHLEGTRYITGHGAKNYLDHALFESHDIEVAYMDYQCLPYPQEHGPFTPYVSILDLIANMGPEGRSVIQSGTMEWREFIR